MRLRFLLVALIVVIGAMGTGLYSQPWAYDFGTGEGSLTTGGATTSSVFANPDYTLFPAIPPNGGGTYHGFVSTSGGGGLYCVNPGISGFGSETELRLEAPTTTGNNGINKFSVNAYNNATRVAYLRHHVRFGNASGGTATSGSFYLVCGTPNSTNSFDDNNLPNITNGSDGEVFVGMRVTFNSNESLTCNYLVPGGNNQSGTWTGTFDSQPFNQGSNYIVEYYMYNEPGVSGTTTYLYNGASVSIAKYTWHVYVNGVRAYTGGRPGAYPSGGAKQNSDLSAFMYYGESSSSGASMFLDETNYNNAFTTYYSAWYSKSSGNLDVYGTWGSQLDGSGESPTSFASAGHTYNIRNNSAPTIGTSWTVSGTGSKVVLGDGTNPCTFTIPDATYYMTGTINVNNNGTLEIANSTLPKIGTLANGSTVRYDYPGNQSVTGTTYYNLDIANGSDKTMLNDVTVTNLTFNTGTLALNNYNLYLAGKFISFYSTNAVFSSLDVSHTEAQVAGAGVGRIWNTEGLFTNSVDVKFTLPYVPLDPLAPLFLWYKDGSTWIKGSSYIPTIDGANAVITVPGITSLNGAAKGPKSWTFAEGDETLPVELSSFTAMISSTNYVQLTWITQSETNVAGFRIYRNTTYDLATAEMLNTFVHATNTSQMQVYVYTDEEIQQNGTYYYWLQNLDLDGSFTFHGPTTITITGHEPGIPPVPVVLGINNAWPNPFNPTLTIKYGMTKSGNAALDIYNQRGQLVRNLMSGARESGSYSQVWDGRDNSGRELPSGVYFIRLQASGKTFGHKVVLLK